MKTMPRSQGTATTRNGKIARLPLAIRQQLNQRLQNGELARDLLSWLNQLPEVQAILAAHFAAKPIDESNLTHWKQGGYLQWEAQEQAQRAALGFGSAPWRSGSVPHNHIFLTRPLGSPRAAVNRQKRICPQFF